MSDRELMQQALEANEQALAYFNLREHTAPLRDALLLSSQALRARLAEPDDEPVAAQCRFPGVAWGPCDVEHARMVMAAPNEWPKYEVRLLYTRPAARKVAGLSEQQARRYAALNREAAAR